MKLDITTGKTIIDFKENKIDLATHIVKIENDCLVAYEKTGRASHIIPLAEIDMMTIKNYKNVRLGLNVNGEIDSVKYPVDGIFNMDAMYDGYLDTWNIATRSEEERIEEFLEENDALLKNRDKIPFKYISDIHYGKKTVWKNPDFEN